jgi:hypothetical protein
MSKLLHLLLAGFFGLALCAVQAQAAETAPRAPTDPNGLWQDVSESAIAARGERWIQPQVARAVALDYAALQSRLALAPMERSVTTRTSPLTLALPMPDGGFADFAMVESPIMEEGAGRQVPVDPHLRRCRHS